MLDKITGGVYKSTPHRVKCQTRNARLSYPFFFDPDYFAQIKPIEGMMNIIDDKEERWDKSSVHEISGTFGEYLIRKNSRSFPELHDKVIKSLDCNN